MATTRFTNSGFGPSMTKYDDALVGYPGKMTAPTAADGGTGDTATVSFTAVSGATSYRALSNPGSFTGTGSSSPVTVSGLSSGTAYTFQVQALNSVGYGAYSDASNSVTPVTPSSFESIATANGTGSSGTITFSSIPSTYKHLQIRMLMKDDGTGGSFSQAQIRFNSDSGSNYSDHNLVGDGSTASANGNGTNTAMTTISNVFPDSNASYANMFGVAIIDIIDYASTTKYKTIRRIDGADENGIGRISLASGSWRSTSAVTSITITDSRNNWTSTSTFALYGIKG